MDNNTPFPRDLFLSLTAEQQEEILQLMRDLVASHEEGKDKGAKKGEEGVT